MLRSGLSSQRIRELIGLFDIHRTTNGAFVLDDRREHESFGLDKVQSVAVSVAFEIRDVPALVDPHMNDGPVIGPRVVKGDLLPFHLQDLRKNVPNTSCHSISLVPT